MALDFTDLRQPPTIQPQYAGSDVPVSNPQQIKAMNEYAALLAKNSMQPVHHWTQGVSNMINALTGGMMNNRAAQLQNMQLKQGGNDYVGGLPTPPSPTPPSPTPPASSADAPSDKSSALPEGASNFASLEGSPDILDRAADATAKQESGGKYDTVVTTNNVKTGQPQSALGKYGIMDFNVGPWTKEILGKEMSKQDFLANKDAQDAVYRGKMSEYISKYGPEGAGRAWLGGAGGVNNPDRRDAFGTSVGDYGKNFVKLLGKGAPGGDAMAFNGQPATPANDATSAITMALSKGATPSGASTPQTVQATPPASPFSQQIDIPPGVMPPASTYNKGSLSNMVTNPYLDSKLRDNALGMYMGTQVNPRDIPTTGGRIIVPPSGGKGYFVPELQKGTEKGPGGIEYPLYQTIQPDGTVKTLEEKGGSAPSAGTSGGTSAPPPPLPPLSPVSPLGAGAPGKGSSLELPNVPSNVLAYNDAGPVTDAPNPVAQAVAAAGPSAAAAPAVTGNEAIDKAQAAMLPAGAPAGDAPISPMGAKMAAALSAPPPLADPNVQVAESNADRRARLMDEGIDFKRREALVADDAKAYTKNIQDYSQIGNASGKNVPQLKAALELTKDPRYYSGLLADPYAMLQKGKAGLAALGITGGDKNAAAPLEVFDKILSGSIVQDLKTQLGGLGQIRLAEINLITQSVANKYNTAPANAAVLSMMIRTAEQAQRVGTIATQYDKGWVPNADGTGWERRQGPPTNAGLQDVVGTYTKAHPLFSDDEIKNVQKTLDISDKTPNPKAPAAQTQAALEKAAGTNISDKGVLTSTEEPAAAETQVIGGKTYFKQGDQWFEK